jgi:hypothetical protein
MILRREEDDGDGDGDGNGGNGGAATTENAVVADELSEWHVVVDLTSELRDVLSSSFEHVPADKLEAVVRRMVVELQLQEEVERARFGARWWVNATVASVWSAYQWSGVLTYASVAYKHRQWVLRALQIVATGM